jgi:dephospho-CoA kinase
VWQGRVAAWQAAGTHAAAVVVIPLLFETDAAAAFTATACVACSEAIQTRRLRERGWSDEEIRRRLAAQLPVREKMARSDYVVWNDGPPEILAAQLDRIPARAQAAVPGGRS